MLRISLLGMPQLYLGNVDLSKVITGRTLALLSYLVVTNRPQTRSVLADLLWTDTSELQARKNLRYVLYDLRRATGDHLLTSYQTVSLNSNHHHWLDVKIFSTYLESEQPTASVELLEDVLNLYQAEFLAGFYIQNAPIFETWLLTQRQKLHRQMIHGLQLLAQQYLTQQNYTAGIQATQRLLTLEPWNEDAHRQQMQLLAYDGQHSAALAQYESCRQALAEEYNAEPLVETTQLYNAIKTGQFNKTPKNRNQEFLSSLDTHSTLRRQPLFGKEQRTQRNLPLQLGPIINWDAIPVTPYLAGRDEEIKCLEHWICVDGCRLISIGGMGGAGKSALVAELVRRLTEQQEEQTVEPAQPTDTEHFDRNRFSISSPPILSFMRIFWCSLTGVASLAQFMAYWWRWCSTVAGVTEIEWLEEDTPLEEQLTYLLAYLHQQRCLLILDQVESILQPGKFAGVYQPGWENFGALLRRIADSPHQSCLVLIGREEPTELAYLAHSTSAVRTLSLTGLTVDAGVALLHGRGFTEPTHELAALVQHYDGLPLALTYLCVLHQRIPTLQLTALYTQEAGFIEEVRKQFDHQFERLSTIEYEILLWLTIERGKVTFDYFWQHCTATTQKDQLLDAHQSLLRRSLLCVEAQGKWVSLSATVLHYITQHLIDLLGTEIFVAWNMKGQRQSTLRPPLFPYCTTVEQPPRHRYQLTKSTSSIELAKGQNVEAAKEQRLIFTKRSLGGAESVAQTRIGHTNNILILPFLYLNRYRLVNPQAAAAIADEQRRFLVLPLVHRLQSRWNAQGIRKRLEELLDYLAQEPYADGTTADYNLRALLAASTPEAAPRIG